MTDEQLVKTRNELLTRHRAQSDAVVKMARPLVAVLKDAGRPESARELEAAFFQLDAIDGEMSEFIQGNLEAVFRSIVKEQ